MARELAENLAKEAERRRIEEERERATMLHSIQESRQNIIRLKEERKLEEQRQDQMWSDFNRKALLMDLINQKEVAQKQREQRIEVGKTNFAMGEEKRARVELEKNSGVRLL